MARNEHTNRNNIMYKIRQQIVDLRIELGQHFECLCCGESVEFSCGWCGEPIEENNFHLDHFFPHSMGGSDHPSNLVIVCPPCNLRKQSYVWPASMLRDHALFADRETWCLKKRNLGEMIDLDWDMCALELEGYPHHFLNSFAKQVWYQREAVEQLGQRLRHLEDSLQTVLAVAAKQSSVVTRLLRVQFSTSRGPLSEELRLVLRDLNGMA